MLTSISQTYDYLSKGGPVLVLLIATSVVCVALIIERIFSLRTSRVFPQKFMNEIESLAAEKKLNEILSLCKISDNPIARILLEGLSKLGRNADEIKEAFEMKGRREVSILERNIDFLGTLAAVGPLLGLMGTVTGMIQTFGVIQQAGVGDPLKLSGGIAEALINTAAGMAVGIPALLAHRFFQHRVDNFVLTLEEFSQKICGLLKG